MKIKNSSIFASMGCLKIAYNHLEIVYKSENQSLGRGRNEVGFIVSGLNHAMHQQPKPKPRYRVINTTSEAKAHYNNGHGESVVLGQSTRNELRATPEYRRVISRLTSGVANSYNNTFDVDMTSSTFHVGDTNVDYTTTFNGNGTATTTFTEFARDGFWDPNVIESNTLGALGVQSSQLDGMGPNLETSGSHPYRYVPSTYIVTYPTSTPFK